MKRPKKILISGFILFNFLTMIRVHLPQENRFFRMVYRPVHFYLSFFSLYQSWDMFSPNPARTHTNISAVVEFEDGSKDTYEFPRVSQQTLKQRYVNGERFRVITEAISQGDNRFMWPDTAKFALRKLKDKNFHKIPLKVSLVRHWYEIPDVDAEFRPHLSKTSSFKSYKFFTHEVL